MKVARSSRCKACSRLSGAPTFDRGSRSRFRARPAAARRRFPRRNRGGSAIRREYPPQPLVERAEALRRDPFHHSVKRLLDDPDGGSRTVQRPAPQRPQARHALQRFSVGGEPFQPLLAAAALQRPPASRTAVAEHRIGLILLQPDHGVAKRRGEQQRRITQNIRCDSVALRCDSVAHRLSSNLGGRGNTPPMQPNGGCRMAGRCTTKLSPADNVGRDLIWQNSRQPLISPGNYTRFMAEGPYIVVRVTCDQFWARGSSGRKGAGKRPSPFRRQGDRQKNC